jgi:16S rRNA (uracil1498-N3)-methyltransferase
MDTIIRQAAEMGVAAVYPFESDYTIAKIEASQVRKKQQRWSKIVEEAVQQSGSSVFTTVHDPVQLRSIDTIWKGGEPALFFHQNQLSQTTLHHYLEHGPEEVGLVIGPEGGFSDDELVYLQTHAFQPVYLGENVLRTETAAVYAVAAVQTILLEKNSWQLHP